MPYSLVRFETIILPSYSSSINLTLELECFTLTIEALEYSETSRTADPTTQNHIPEHSNLQQHRCENLASRKNRMSDLCKCGWVDLASKVCLQLLCKEDTITSALGTPPIVNTARYRRHVRWETHSSHIKFVTAYLTLAAL